MRTSLLDQLVLAMEELEPGALQFYTDELKGKKFKVIVPDPQALVDAMDDRQISELMFAIAAKMGNKINSQQQKEQLAVNY